MSTIENRCAHGTNPPDACKHCSRQADNCASFEKTFAVANAHNVKIANDLDGLQSVENDGRGVMCVKSMVTYLRRNQFAEAQGIYQVDGDKTRQYPALEAALRKYFGCRLHGTHDCEKCKSWGF